MLKTVSIIAAVLLFIIGCGSHIRRDADNDVEPDLSQFQPGPAPADNPPIDSDQYPRIVFKKIPQYPSQALANEIEGFVIIQAYVDRHGKVTRARVEECSMPDLGFEEAAVKAAYLCKYKPALRIGKPVGLWIEYRVDFTLQ